MQHIPVLLNEVLRQFDYLANAKDGYFVDATLGAGGHSIAISNAFQVSRSTFHVIGIDKDGSALEIAKGNIDKAGLIDQFALVHDDLKNIKKMLAGLNIDKIDGALIDLGVSSMQLDQSERGFTFQNADAPLDMRMNQEQKTTAEQLLLTMTRQELEKILRELGEERFAKNIAKNIARQRKERPVKTAGDLLEILRRSIPAKVQATQDKHFATNAFRALRIAVNEELAGLEQAIIDFTELLKPSARLAVISFHSTEDRIVKKTFQQLANPCICLPDLPQCACGRKPTVKIITKKPIIPSEQEIAANPRSRSAKLRAVEKL